MTAVWVTDGAARDLDELVAGAVERSGMAEAERLLDQIEAIFARIAAEGPRPFGSHPLPGHPRARALQEAGSRITWIERGGAVGIVAIAPIGRSSSLLLLRRLLDA